MDNDSQPQNLEDAFQNSILNDVESSEILFDQMDAYFLTSDPIRDFEQMIPRFRWYTLLLWRRLTSFSPEIVINVGLARQVPTASKLDIVVLEEIIWYLALRASDEDRPKMYAKMKKVFLESQAIMGMWQGKNYTVRDAVEEIKRTRRPDSSSLETAELSGKLKEIMFPKGEETAVKELFAQDQNTAVINFKDLIGFFLDAEPDTINDLAESYIHPKIEPLPVIENEEAESSGSISYPSIKSQIESKFPTGPDGQFLDLKAVFAELDRIRKETGDPRIMDLYYYNEADGRFEWNTELLGKS